MLSQINSKVTEKVILVHLLIWLRGTGPRRALKRMWFCWTHRGKTAHDYVHEVSHQTDIHLYFS